MKKNILFSCGSMNITTQMQQIAAELPEYDRYFTPFYADGFIKLLNTLNLVEFTIIGDKRAGECYRYLEDQKLTIDYGGKQHDYDLVVTCSDLVLQKNVRDKKLIVVQEGITDPERFSYHLVKTLQRTALPTNSTITASRVKGIVSCSSKKALSRKRFG